MVNEPARDNTGELLPGNEVAQTIISHAALAGRVANAYLFKGPKGSPKDALAERFAKRLLCESADAEGYGCGECRSCRMVASGQHPDLFIAEKEGATIKIKKSHEMLREALMKPYQSERKVFLIKDAEDLTIEASNALLKILEEPPPYVTFLLTTSNASAIPDTILSRCQVVPVKAYSPEALERVLIEGGASPEAAREAVALSGGNITRAQRILAKGNTSRGEEILKDILSASVVETAQRLAKADAAERLDLLDDLEIELVRRLRADPGRTPAVLQALKAVLRAKERLRSSANALLTCVVLFVDLARALKRTQGM